MIQRAVIVRNLLELGEELVQERQRSYALQRDLLEARRQLNEAKAREQQAWSSRNGAVHQVTVLRRQLSEAGKRKG